MEGVLLSILVVLAGISCSSARFSSPVTIYSTVVIAAALLPIGYIAYLALVSGSTAHYLLIKLSYGLIVRFLKLVGWIKKQQKSREQKTLKPKREKPKTDNELDTLGYN